MLKKKNWLSINPCNVKSKNWVYVYTYLKAHTVRLIDTKYKDGHVQVYEWNISEKIHKLIIVKMGPILAFPIIFFASFAKRWNLHPLCVFSIVNNK